MIEQEKPQKYRVFYTNDGKIIENNRPTTTLEQLRTDFPFPNWAFRLPNEVPENWQDMTIVDGEFVLASAEVIEARRVARLAAETEAVRQARTAQYAATTDPLMIEIIERYAAERTEDETCTIWLSEKNKVKEKYPKPIK